VIAFGDGAFRTIYLDRQGHDQSVPSWTGHSTGKWDGGKLVVETANFRGESAQMGFGPPWPVSDQVKFTETFELSPDGNTVSLKQVYEDAAYLKEPVARMVYLKRQAPDVELVYTPCLENVQGAAEFEKMMGKYF